MDFYQKQEYKFCQYLINNTINKPQTYTEIMYGIAYEIGTEGDAGLNDLIRRFDKEEYLTTSYSKIDVNTNLPKEEDRLYSLSNKGIAYYNHLVDVINIEGYTIELQESTIALNKSTSKTNKNIKNATWVIAVATIFNLIVSGITCWVSYNKHDEVKVSIQQSQKLPETTIIKEAPKPQENQSHYPSLKTAKK